MPYSPFIKKRSWGAKKASVTIRKSGRIYISRIAVNNYSLEKYTNVQLLYDTRKSIIALKFTNLKDDTYYSVIQDNVKGRRIVCKSFLDYYRITPEKTYSIPIIYDDITSMYLIHLKRGNYDKNRKEKN